MRRPSVQVCLLLAAIGLAAAVNAVEQASNLDADLAKLQAVADSFPPEIGTPADRSRVEALWKSVEARLLQAPAHDFETELKLGNLYRMGHNLDVKGAWDKAVAHLNEASRLRPESPLPLTMLGAHYSGSGHAADAVAPLQRALTLSGDKPSPAIYANLAFAYYQLGDSEKVVQYANAYLKTNPDSSTMKLLKERSEAALRGGPKPKQVEIEKKPPRR
ncbi:MAG TPA: tetratricopeptide repeat protein [Thermoanaerobaculia bacterium]|jgi:tetratricopeptide (TPR) repeat protein